MLISGELLTLAMLKLFFKNHQISNSVQSELYHMDDSLTFLKISPGTQHVTGKRITKLITSPTHRLPSSLGTPHTHACVQPE